MSLHGNWQKGGVLEFLDGDKLLHIIRLPPASWTLLAILFRASLEASGGHWTDAYVCANDLADGLEHHKVATEPTQQRIYQLVNKTRSLLADHVIPNVSEGGRASRYEWAKHLLENSSRSGYRIGLAASQLSLTVGGVAYVPAPRSPEPDGSRETEEGSSVFTLRGTRRESGHGPATHKEGKQRWALSG